MARKKKSINNKFVNTNDTKQSQKRNKNYSTGKSKSSKSIITNMYTQSSKKRKRLGKTCIHFNVEKLTCKISHMLCKDADNCTSYVTNLKAIQNKQQGDKKSSDINNVGVTAIVLNDNRKCTNNKHDVVDLNAIIRIVEDNGNISTCTVPAAYCKECDTYFMLKKDYKIAKAKGKILCPIIDFTQKGKSQNANKNLSSSESRIHQLGYNVQRGSNYTKEQRQVILANIIENTNISKHEIESCIMRPMLQHKNQPNYSEAVMAWKNDLEFIVNYKKGNMLEVLVDKIVIGKRI